MSEQQSEHFERAIELCVLAPIGFAATLKDMAPMAVAMFVNRGRTEVEQRQQQLQTVKSTGEVAIAFGVPMLREKVAQRVGTLRERVVPAAPAPSGAAPSEPTTAAATDPHAEAPADAVVATSVNGNGASNLAIPGYDALSASQVVERLVGLDADELAEVRAYELAHRQRRTILGKIEQLDAARHA